MKLLIIPPIGVESITYTIITSFLASETWIRLPYNTPLLTYTIITSFLASETGLMPTYTLTVRTAYTIITSFLASETINTGY